MFCNLKCKAIKNIIILHFFIGINCFVSAQQNDDMMVDKDDLDTIQISNLFSEEIPMVDGKILLSEVNYTSLPNFNNEADKNYYFWLERKVKNAYPYYLKAIQEYENISDSIQKSKNNREIKKIVKKRQKELAEQYENRLKKLTKTEGKIFAKLMHRRTGKTTYQIIKELRGGWSAFWWNVKAGVFEIDLDEGFNPLESRQDYFIETIINRGKAKGLFLEY
ncbi:MAG: DUF4294 domain-containing protein [Flavobacteriales bacterium]|nr:DUF4294 domain-containing protein [Flavobacteriales bacterium]